MKLKTPTKRLDKSHLTEQEKWHSVGLILFALLTMTLAIIWSRYGGPWFVVFPMMGLGTYVIGFVWGYIGAVEDERSRSVPSKREDPSRGGE